LEKPATRAVAPARHTDTHTGNTKYEQLANQRAFFARILDPTKVKPNHDAAPPLLTRVSNSRTARIKYTPPQTLRADRYNTKQEQVARERRTQAYKPARVCTAYKKVAQKILPVNQDEPSGDTPGGRDDWEELAIEQEKQRDIRDPTPWDAWIHPKVSEIERGSRLTTERIAALKIGIQLTPRERDLLLTMLSNREAALSWDFKEIGRVHPDVAPDQKIRTIPHVPFQVKNFIIPRSLQPIAISMLTERCMRGLLEECHGPYRNPWFLVQKGPKELRMYRLINSATALNEVTFKDACLPPNIEEFVEEFAGLPLSSVLDAFSGYDQIGLDVASRNLTAFQTPLGLLRMTTLPQGATNSVAQFVRIITKILRNLLIDTARPFLDDIGVKTTKTNDLVSETMPGVRSFILDHIVKLDQTLLKLERAGMTISGEKMQLCMEAIELVGYICDSDGRHPNKTKVSKILSWGPCKSKTEVRAFVGTVGYFRIWISFYIIRALPLYALIKKDIEFYWGEVEQAAMEDLKQALANASALAVVNYTLNPRTGEIDEIIVLVDASGEGWGGVLCQMQKEKRRPVRFESGLWVGPQLKYDAGKLECLGLLMMLRKCRHWLYGVHFTLETDANTLIQQLNNHITDIPNAMTTRWIAYIKLFDFTLRHVPGRVHSAADGLSRRGHQPDDKDRDITGDIEHILSAELNHITVAIGSLLDSSLRPCCRRQATKSGGRILASSYSDESEEIAQYLNTLSAPEGWSREKFKRLQRRALEYLVKDDLLYKRSYKQTPLRRVLDGEEERKEVISRIHDEIATHRGREATYYLIAERYYWSGMYEDVRAFIKTCKECQFRDSRRYAEEMYPTFANYAFEVVGIDTVHMKPSFGKKYLFVARCGFLGWVEARAVGEANALNMAKFLWEEIICRHGLPQRIITDGGPENKDVAEELLRTYKVKKIEVSAYHPQANGMIEVGHRPLKNCLAKLEASGRGSWVTNLHSVL